MSDQHPPPPGAPATPGDAVDPRIVAVTDEMGHLLYVIRDLDSIAPTAVLPPWFLATIRRRYLNLYAERYAEWRQLLGDAPAWSLPQVPTRTPTPGWSAPAAPAQQWAGPGAPADPGPVSPGGSPVWAGAAADRGSMPPWGAPPPEQPSPREPWLMPFLTSNAILILSYLGGFLLVVATLLFEAYGPDLGGPAHLAGVVALDAAFGLAAWFCVRRPILRIVGETYTAVFALLTPLTMVAAYRFLGLGTQGVAVSTAAAAGAAACMVLYGILGMRLHSMAYATLAEAALVSGWVSLVISAGSGSWTAAWTTPIVPLCAVAGLAPMLRNHAGAIFSHPADVLRHPVAGCAVAVALGQAYLNAQGFEAAQLTATVAVVTVGYIVAAGLSRRRSDAGLAAVGFTVTVVLATQSAHLGGGGAAIAAIALAALGLLYGLGAFGIPPAAHPALFVGAAVQSTLAAVLPIDRPAVQTGVLVTVVLTSVLMTLRSRHVEWMLLPLSSAALQLTQSLQLPPGDGFAPGYIAIVLAVLAPATAATAARLRRVDVAFWVAVEASAAALSGAVRLDAGPIQMAACLITLGAAWTITAHVLRDASRTAAYLRAGAAIQLLVTGGLALDNDAGRTVVLLAGVLIGLALAIDAEEPLWLLTGFGALAMQCAIASESLSPAGAAPRVVFVPLTLAALTVATAVYAIRLRRPQLALVVNGGVSLTALAVSFSFGGDALIYSAILVMLGGLGVAGATLFRNAISPNTRRSFIGGAALRLVVAAVLPVGDDVTRLAILLPVIAVFVVIAVAEMEPSWVLPAGIFFTWAWYFAVPLVLPPRPGPGPSDLALLLTPLPVLYVIIALGLRTALRPEQRRTWPAMFELLAVGVGVLTLGIGFSASSALVASWDVIGFAALISLVGLAEDWPATVPMMALGTAAGLFSLLTATSVPAEAVAPVIALWAWVVYLGGRAFPPGERWAPWGRLHRYSGIAVASATALLCVGVPAFGAPRSAGALTSFGVATGLAVMLAIDGGLNRIPALDYASAATGALATLWLVTYAGIGGDVLYPSIPAAALLLGALAARHDRRIAIAPGVVPAALGIGSVVLLVSSLVQVFGGGAVAGHTVLLLMEGVALVVLGVGDRLRLLVIAGSAGAALAALRALYDAMQSIPLWAVFGVTALLLLGISAWLAGHRTQLAMAREAVRAEWQRWE